MNVNIFIMKFIPDIVCNCCFKFLFFSRKTSENGNLLESCPKFTDFYHSCKL